MVGLIYEKINEEVKEVLFFNGSNKVEFVALIDYIDGNSFISIKGHIVYPNQYFDYDTVRTWEKEVFESKYKLKES